MKYILILLFTLSFTIAGQANAAKLTYGECDTKECTKRFKQVKKHARKHITANIMLGDMYLHGYGTDIDIEEAVDAYKKAGRWGSLLGKYKAGLLLLQSEDEDDKEDGLDLLRDAAKKGHKNAKYFMAEILSNPKHGVEDIAQADEWLAASVEMKHEYVPQTIVRLENEGRLTAQYLPQTMAVLADDNWVQKTIEQAAADEAASEKARAATPSDVEVIQVNGPQLAELIDYGIEYFENSASTINRGSTGTRVRGRGCEDVNGCSSIGVDEFSRHYTQFILGDEALKFRGF